ncbi:MAG: ParB/RepB/Spo0J family partition protein [Chloracidobacterium sp.]|nr:ParB/RepB/Spo0J family partition protein [Chloracidobacterium sp.]
MTATIQKIPCRQIFAGDNDRTVFDEDGLSELAASIKEHGLAQPITVRLFAPDPMCVFGGDRFGERAQYQIVAGERRFRAVSQVLKLEAIDCIVRELNDEEASAIMLAENVGRRDLDPVDEMLAYRKRIESQGWSIEKISEKCGVSKKRVEKRLLLGSVREDILHHVRRGTFPIGHAEMMSVLDHNRQMIAARPIIEGKAVNFRQFREIVDALFAQQSQESLFDLALFGGALETPQVSIVTAKDNYPIAADLPDPFITPEHHTGAITLAYVLELQAQGHHREAAAIGRLLAFLCKHRYTYLPTKAVIKT